MKNNFKIVKRNSKTCEHDTGVFHSVGIDCEFVESMMKDCHMLESDPEHQEIWHNSKQAIILEA